MGSIHHSIFYVQEYIEKPGRDIRAFVVGDRVVAASYRTSESLDHEHGPGRESISCPVTPEIEDDGAAGLPGGRTRAGRVSI